MFKIDEFYGEMIIPIEYENKVKKWLNNDETLVAKVKNQVWIKKL
jgi:hypothetical protein